MRAHRYIPAPRRLFNAIQFNEQRCWLMNYGLSGGYAQIRVNGRHVKAHRYAFELLVGPIPEGLQLDHLCRVRNCVNPEHLEPVTCRENLMRAPTLQAANARKTHCSRGHEFTPENTRRTKTQRVCRTCANQWSQEHRARKRAAAA